MGGNANLIGKSELIERIEKRIGKIVDIRPIAAYNGWRLKGEKRGGHVPGAKTFPLRWLQLYKWQKMLSDKRIKADEPVAVYGYDEKDTNIFVENLAKEGFKDISVYTGFVPEWSAGNSLPLQKLEKYRQLVYPEWVKKLIDGGKPPEFEGKDYKIFHAHYGFEDDYNAGHIPGAIALDTLWLEEPETWNRRSPEELEAAFLRLGITADTPVILYGHYSYPNNSDPFPGRNAGHIAAIRCAAIMMYAGVKDVRILNGGFSMWLNSGYEITEIKTTPSHVTEFGAKIPVHPEYFIDTPEAKRILASENAELVSIRSREEFLGNVSGYNYIEKAGRIPGAVFGNCGSDAYHMENYRNHDHTMREYHEVASNWEENGITPDKEIAFYCGTGWRASEAFMNAYLMGWKNIAIYDGGWMEWCSDPENPIERGVPEEWE